MKTSRIFLTGFIGLTLALSVPALAQEKGASPQAQERAGDQSIFHRVTDWFATVGKPEEESRDILAQRHFERETRRLEAEMDRRAQSESRRREHIEARPGGQALERQQLGERLSDPRRANQPGEFQGQQSPDTTRGLEDRDRMMDRDRLMDREHSLDDTMGGMDRDHMMDRDRMMDRDHMMNQDQMMNQDRMMNRMRDSNMNLPQSRGNSQGRGL